MLDPVCTCGARHGLTLDRSPRDPGLIRARRLEERYSRDLRKIARAVGDIVKAWMPSDLAVDLSHVPGLQAALARYAEAIRPWAHASADRIVAEVAIRDRKAWAARTKAMSRALRHELTNAPTGQAMQLLIAEQVEQITSLPREAGQRVYDLALKGLEEGGRAPSIAREILRTGEVTAGRATMIGRTAVSTTASTLTEVRSRHVGSTGYIWRTAGDSDVRRSHRDMEGEFVDWDKPPTLDGYKAHAGRAANCRCYPEPVLPDIE